MKQKNTIMRASLFGVSLLMMGLATSQAKSVVLPLEAIIDSATFRAKEFNEKYTGIDVSGYYPDDPGYYISYKHKNLTYYFGPVETYEEAVDWKSKLDRVRQEIVYQRPSLASHEVVIYNFSLETIEGAGRKLREGNEDSNASGGETYEIAAQPGEQGQGGQDSGLIIIQDGGDGQSDQPGQNQGDPGSQQGQQGSKVGQQGQQGIQIIQSSGQGQKSGQGSKGGETTSSSNSKSGSSSSNSSASGSSSSNGSGSSNSSGGGGGGGGEKPSWWQVLKGIFGG